MRSPAQARERTQPQEKKMAKGLMCALLAALAIGAAGGARAQECSGAMTAEEALRAEDARYAAQTTNDFAAMERLYGEDLVYIHSSAVVDNKASYIQTMRSGDVRYRVMKRSDAKVRTYGCIAIITANGDFDVTVKGQDLTVPLRFHAIWAKRPAGLQFISWQATRVPAKSPLAREREASGQFEHSSAGRGSLTPGRRSACAFRTRASPAPSGLRPRRFDPPGWTGWAPAAKICLVPAAIGPAGPPLPWPHSSHGRSPRLPRTRERPGASP
jgi:hypothetical protein